jgi:hypothetical protein
MRAVVELAGKLVELAVKHWQSFQSDPLRQVNFLKAGRVSDPTAMRVRQQPDFRRYMSSPACLLTYIVSSQLNTWDEGVQD